MSPVLVRDRRPVAGRGRIDPPHGVGCVHDMLPGTCAICRGLPYLPPLDSDWKVLAEDRSDPLRWVPAETVTECASCHQPIRRAQSVAYSRAFEGNVGRCCEDVA